jgi:hypothetical protein
MAKECDCGGLRPQPGDKPLSATLSADAVLSEVRLFCDNETGVFFFRSSGKLYLRLVECNGE